MKIGAILAAIMLLFGTFAIVTVDDAYAARMGGGKSFGSKPFMKQSAPPPAMRQQNRQQANQPGAAAAARPGGMFGGMGGIFGGLLAGTLLGSLLSGNGFGGGGGFMDIILLAILGFVAYKLFMRFRQKQQEPQPSAAGGFARRDLPDKDQQQSMQRKGVFGQRDFPGTQQQGGSGWGAFSQNQQAVDEPSVQVPADFNVDEFLRGAKAAYNRLQKSWDKRDLADIAQFVTPAVLQTLQEQAKEDPGTSNTEIMLVNAQLEGFEQDGNDQRAQVFFDVLMRESPAQQQPDDVKEIWHFVRDGNTGEWKLDGIQQVQ